MARHQAQVGDAAQVEHRAVFAGVTQHGGVEGRHQRRALAAGGDVAPAEVGDGGDAGGFGNDAGVAQLLGEGCGAAGVVAQGLAVRTDGGHFSGGHAGIGQGPGRGLGEGLAEPGVEPADFVQAQQGLGLGQPQHVVQQVRGQGIGAAEQHPRRGFEAHQGGVDAVGAGARDQAKKKPAVGGGGLERVAGRRHGVSARPGGFRRRA